MEGREIILNVLVIDDEEKVGQFFVNLLEDSDYDVYLGFSGRDFRRLVLERTYQLAMIDVKLPDINGLEIVKELKQQHPHCKVIVMTGFSTVKTAVEAIKYGANDYIEKPFDDIDTLEALIKELTVHNQSSMNNDMYAIAEEAGFMIGDNQEMKHLLMLAYKIASKNVNVLIEGETGTGKEVLARFIYLASKRRNNPFIGINCGAISENLLESELFGHEKGAFTGAIKERKGVLEIANNGVLFLDEIGEASLTTQVKLLRVLETGEYMRVGGEVSKRTNTRIIAATHVHLEEAVKKQQFREDLLYRLDVVKLTLPPLRKRTEDIPKLLEHYLDRQQNNILFAPEAIELMKSYSWPGNIRELVNVVKRALSLKEEDTSIITPDLLPDKLKLGANTTVFVPASSENKEFSYENYVQQCFKQLLIKWEAKEVDLEAVLKMIRELEMITGREFVKKSLKETYGNRKEAAKNLGVSPRKLRYLLNEKGETD